MRCFDSHAHLTCEAMAADVDGVLQRAAAAGIGGIVNICTDRKSLSLGIQVAEKYHWVKTAGAITPHDAATLGSSDWAAFEEAARSGKLVALGETGLDYYYERSDRKTQQKLLIRYLGLAAELQLPVIFHCREAFADLFEIVDREYPKGAPALLHCFTGTKEEAEGVWQRGWFLSLSGIVTYKKSDSLREIARAAPLDRLLIETDSPYLAPQSKRGKTNEPAYLLETASCIANQRGATSESIAEATTANAIRFFGL